MLLHKGAIIWFEPSNQSDNQKVVESLHHRLSSESARSILLDHRYLHDHHHITKHLLENDPDQYRLMVTKTLATLKQSGMFCLVTLPVISYLHLEESFQNDICDVLVVLDFQEAAQGKDLSSKDEVHDTSTAPSHEWNDFPHFYLQAHGEAVETACARIVDHLKVKGLIDDSGDYMNAVYVPNRFEKLYASFPMVSLRLFKKHRKKSLKTAFSSVLDDFMQYAGMKQYDYEQRTIFIAALPKSGSSWLHQLLGLVPGYHERTVYDPSRATSFHDITPFVFDLLPKYSYSIIKLHTRYTPYNFKTISGKIGKFVVLFRDLRDMCISRYFHVLNEREHRHHALYTTLSKDEAISHCIRIIETEYIDWVEKWHRIAMEHSETILEIRYEDLTKDLVGTMKRVLSFHKVPFDEILLDRMKKTQLVKPENLQMSLEKGNTRRKGIIGDWRNHFSTEHKADFKKAAGNLLIKLGYENGLEW